MANTGTATQDADKQNLSDGQGTDGAPSAPKVNNAAPAKDVAAPDVTITTETVVAPVQGTTQVAAATTASTVQEQWPTFADQALTASANLMKNAGLAPSDAKTIFAKTLQTGKIEDVDLPALEAKIGKDKAALAMIGVKDYFTRQQAFATKTIEEVESVFGGKDAYTKVKEWAIAKASTDSNFAKDVDKYREMFNAGGVSARAAALDLLSVYSKAPDTSGVVTKIVNGNKTVSVDTSNAKPLSRSEYMTLLKAAEKTGNKREIADLNARRRAGIKAKI
ncbi:MAG TPA: hypothetical protein VNZ45_16810 [Bacteroidia bacterium]|jgi:hypothetical protein|nr:hypothetical protein [Bacteroidia bacterium]